MKRLLPLVLVLGCDPIWSVHATARDPENRPIENATVALACPDGTLYASQAVRSDRTGAAQLGGLGNLFPPGCDVFVAKPGFRTARIRYADICPKGPRDCDRVVSYDLVLEPSDPAARREAVDHQQ